MKLKGKFLLFIVLLLITNFSCKRLLTDSKVEFDEGLSLKTNIVLDSLLDDKALVNDSTNQNYNLFNALNEQTKVIPKKKKYENFEVTFLDFYRDKLQRVFIVIDTEDVYNDLVIKSIVCEILKSFEVHNKSNVSFFSDVKYADYKTNLFVLEGHPLSIEEYSNWRNQYYLAEFEFQTNEYITYPYCTKDFTRQKTLIIKCN